VGVIAGLILAAGGGSRFGGSRSKLLADLEGRPLLEHAIAAACAVPELERVVVVLGARADEIVSSVSFGRAEPVVCPDWAQGQSASLRCGVRALAGAEKVIVTLGDAPLITTAAIARFPGQPPGARAVYRGQPGHPVVLGPRQLEAAATGTSGDRGFRDMLRDGPLIECGDVCSGRDVDTPDDLEAIRHEVRAVV
jgi:CTP:molybdopterin cytidylyltransferase MocA